LRALAFNVSGVVSLVFSLADFKTLFRIRLLPHPFVSLLFDLRRHIVSFRLPGLQLQLHPTSTFSIHLVARSCALREGE
jgi:hypothetical protein